VNNEAITKQDLRELEERLSARFATKEDLADLEGRLKQDMADLEGRLKQDMAEMEERLRQLTREAVHDLETKLLSAFFGWAERMEKVLDRLTTEVRHMHAMDLNLEERMRALENRVFNLEKRIMQHPPAA
jgi:phage shock protein A